MLAAGAPAIPPLRDGRAASRPKTVSDASRSPRPALPCRARRHRLGPGATRAARRGAPEPRAVPAPPDEAPHARVRAHAVLLLAPRARSDPLRVRALEEPGLHRGRDLLVGREAEDAGRLGPGRAALDDRQPLRGLRPRPRDHRDGVSGWSAPFGFNVRWSNLPQPLETYPGMSRWTVVGGATSYQVWFPASPARSSATRTNAVDHREFYAFHQQAQYSGTVRWRVRAVRSLYGKIPTGLPTVSYGPWSPTYTTTNPAIADGAVSPSLAAADTTVSNADDAALHELTPGFAFTGTTRAAAASRPTSTASTSSATRDCVNVIHRGSIVGSPAYVPRTTGSLKLPLTTTDVIDRARRRTSKDLGQGQTGAAAVHVRLGQGDEHGERPRAGEAGGDTRARPAHHPGLRRTAGRRPLEHAARERPVAAGDAEVLPAPRSTSGTAAGRTAASTGRWCRCASRPPTRSGRSVRRRDRTRCEHLPTRRLGRLRGDQLVRIGAGDAGDADHRLGARRPATILDHARRDVRRTARRDVGRT